MYWTNNKSLKLRAEEVEVDAPEPEVGTVMKGS